MDADSSRDKAIVEMQDSEGDEVLQGKFEILHPHLSKPRIGSPVQFINCTRMAGRPQVCEDTFGSLGQLSKRFFPILRVAALAFHASSKETVFTSAFIARHAYSVNSTEKAN